MITYELAKKLKNAGFLQSLKSGSCFKIEGESPCYCDTDGFKPEEDYLKIPTLSELIETCGDRFGNLIKRKDNKWEVCSSELNQWASITEGQFPEEAVANLWLELNKQ